MLMNAKQFCSETGWPLKTIRRMCRTGQLEHWQRGRVYLLNKDETLVRLELFKNQNIPAQGPGFGPAQAAQVQDHGAAGRRF